MKSAAIILAAGVSEKIKQPKPLLCVNGVPMVRHVAESMRRAGIGQIIVVTGYKADAVRRCLQGCGVEFAANRHYAENGMLDSLKMGLILLKPRCDKIIVSPADIPLVKPETIKILLQSSSHVAKPICGGREGHPIALSKAAADKISAYDGEGGLRGALGQLRDGTEYISVSDPGVLMDANDKDEYLELISRGRELSGSEKLHLEYDLRLAIGDTVIDGELISVLELVEYTGSLQTAGECVGASYAKSWRRIRELESLLGVSLVCSAVGGAKGGGTRLTDQGALLVEAYRSMCGDGKKTMEKLFQEHFPDELVQKLQK